MIVCESHVEPAKEQMLAESGRRGKYREITVEEPSIQLRISPPPCYFGSAEASARANRSLTVCPNPGTKMVYWRRELP